MLVVLALRRGGLTIGRGIGGGGPWSSSIPSMVADLYYVMVL
jgi:hypothetical protein